ncbi:DUF3159 domain-containing protein [Pseudonocardia endophytica]|nr:DUF3159 domain-containing protein [Pseudonocardia endophytica]
MAEDAVRHAAPQRTTVLDRMGGPLGSMYSTVPVLVFLAADAFFSLSTTVVVSLATALALTGFRLLRGESLTAALGGVAGVAVVAGVVVWTGAATGVLPGGIWVALVVAVAVTGTVSSRRR